MRITFAIVNYWPSVGGMQTLVERVAERLVEMGHEVEVLTIDALRPPGGRDPGRVGRTTEIRHGVTIRRFPMVRGFASVQSILRRLQYRLTGRISSWLLMLADVPLAPRLVAAMRRATASSDAVVLVNWPMWVLLAAARPRSHTRSALIAVPLHHSETAFTGAPARLTARADGVVCLTEAERLRLIDAGIPGERISVIPPGLKQAPEAVTAPEARATLGLPETTTVGFVSRLTLRKGIDTFVAAADHLRRDRAVDSIHFLLAGSRTTWDGVGAILGRSATPPAEWVSLIEDFDDSVRHLMYSACDVIVFPTRSESFGLVILEAWATGRAVIASDLPAIRCTIRDSQDGILFPPGDAIALARCVGALLDDPERREHVAQRGKQRLSAEFALANVAQQWETCLRDAISRHSAPPKHLAA